MSKRRATNRNAVRWGLAGAGWLADAAAVSARTPVKFNVRRNRRVTYHGRDEFVKLINEHGGDAASALAAFHERGCPAWLKPLYCALTLKQVFHRT